MSASFWEEDCPERAPSLSHVRSPDCAAFHVFPRHLPDQCCHCLQQASHWAPPALSRRVGESTFAVSSSERAAARQPWDAWVEAVRQGSTKPPDPLREPAIASGQPGSGELTDSDRHRLEFYVCFLRGWRQGDPEEPRTAQNGR